jgi:hypothetical protein
MLRTSSEQPSQIGLPNRQAAKGLALGAGVGRVVTDHRFLMRTSVTALEVAEHILQQAASSVRDLNGLKKLRIR